MAARAGRLPRSSDASCRRRCRAQPAVRDGCLQREHVARAQVVVRAFVAGLLLFGLLGLRLRDGALVVRGVLALLLHELRELELLLLALLLRGLAHLADVL